MNGQSENIKLLIVDDEEDFLEASEKALVRRGFIVETALDGASAISLIAEQIFDAVVLDIKMPGLDGVEVFQHIKKMSPNLPVIMLTGHGNVQQAFDTSKDGVFEYLTKPCSVEKIMEVVRAAVISSKGAAESSPSKSTDIIRLLVINDSRDGSRSLCKAIRHRELQITSASDDEESFRLLKRIYFDVVLLDIATSASRAIPLIRHIKQMHPLSEIILLVDFSLTIASLDEVKDNLFEILVKPITPNVIVEKIIEAFRQRRRNQREQQKDRIRNILERNTD